MKAGSAERPKSWCRGEKSRSMKFDLSPLHEATTSSGALIQDRELDAAVRRTGGFVGPIDDRLRLSVPDRLEPPAATRKGVSNRERGSRCARAARRPRPACQTRSLCFSTWR